MAREEYPTDAEAAFEGFYERFETMTNAKTRTTPPEESLPTSQEDAIFHYCVDCPQCEQEAGESDRSLAGTIIECACGCKFRVVR